MYVSFPAGFPLLIRPEAKCIARSYTSEFEGKSNRKKQIMQNMLLIKSVITYLVDLYIGYTVLSS